MVHAEGKAEACKKHPCSKLRLIQAQYSAALASPAADDSEQPQSGVSDVRWQHLYQRSHASPVSCPLESGQAGSDHPNLPLDGMYHYALDGTGVNVYVLDTVSHPSLWRPGPAHLEIPAPQGKGIEGIFFVSHGRGHECHEEACRGLLPSVLPVLYCQIRTVLGPATDGLHAKNRELTCYWPIQGVRASHQDFQYSSSSQAMGSSGEPLRCFLDRRCTNHLLCKVCTECNTIESVRMLLQRPQLLPRKTMPAFIHSIIWMWLASKCSVCLALHCTASTGALCTLPFSALQVPAIHRQPRQDPEP